MKKILYGCHEALYHYCLKQYQNSRNGIWFYTKDATPQGFPFYWSGIRCLLPQLRALVGSKKYEEALAKDKAVASILLYGLKEELTKEELKRRTEFVVSLHAYGSHSWYAFAPFLKSFAKILYDIINGHNIMLICPSIAHMDANSLGLLRHLVGLYPDLDFTLGYDTDYIANLGETLIGDEHGIVWGYNETAMKGVADNFLMLEDIESIHLPADSIDSTILKTNPVPKHKLDRLDDNIDQRAFDLIKEYYKSKENVASEALKSILLELCSRAFAAGDFSITLRYGQKLDELGFNLTKKEKAKLYNYIGVSAHNRQFLTHEGEASFNDFILANFYKAIENETNPEILYALWYRVVVTVGRRSKKFEKGIEIADKVINDLPYKNQLDDLKKALHLSWTKNMRAYLKAQITDWKGAIEDIEDAFERLKKEVLKEKENLTTIQYRQLCHDCSVFAVRRAQIARYMQEPAKEEEWLQNSYEITHEDTFVDWRAPLLKKMETCKKKLKFEEARAIAIRVLKSAKAELNVSSTIFILTHIADLDYKLGDLQESIVNYNRAYIISNKTKTGNTLLLQLAMINILIHDEQYDQARYKITTLLDEIGDNVAIKVKLLGWKALIASRTNQIEQTHSLLNNAIEQAAVLGERDLLMFISKISGDICSYFGEKDDALYAYKSVIELGSIEKEENQPPIEDVVYSLLRVLEINEFEENIFLELLKLFNEYVALNSEVCALSHRIARQLSVALSLNPKFKDHLSIDKLEKCLMQRKQYNLKAM